MNRNTPNNNNRVGELISSLIQAPDLLN